MASVYPIGWVNKQLSLSSVSYTAIPIPMNGSKLMLKNQGQFDVFIRTDSADPTTQETIHPDGELVLPLTAGTFQLGFVAGLTAAFAQSFSGTGPLLVRGIL